MSTNPDPPEGLVNSFISFDGGRPTIRFVTLATSLVSGVILAWFNGIVGVIVGYSRAIDNATGGAGSALSSIIMGVLGPAIVAVDQAWESATMWLPDGLFAFPMAILVVGVASAAFAWGVTQVAS